MNFFLLQRSHRKDLVIALGLSVLTLVTRIPFASRMIYEGDSARFALAMLDYDVTQMRPHAPGYFLYVMAAKFLNLLIGNSGLSLVTVSILSSTLIILTFYFLAHEIYDRSTAIISSLILLSSPLFWFNSEMPFTYALETLFCTFFAYACYRIITGQTNGWLLASIVFGLSVGIRQNLVVLFLPLWIYALKRCSAKQILLSILIFGLTCLAWFVPMVVLSGGFDLYFSALDAQFTSFVLNPAPFSIQAKWRLNSLLRFLVYSFGVGILFMLYHSGRFFRLPLIVEDIRLRFLLCWLLPALAFFIGVNLWNTGHILVILPPLCLFLAESVKTFAEDLAEASSLIASEPYGKFFRSFKFLSTYKGNLSVVLALLVLINAFVFLIEDSRVSYATIKKNDSHLSELIRLTKENFSAGNSMILAGWLNTQATLYLPDYMVYCPLPLIISSEEIPIDAQNVYISYGHQISPKAYWIPTGFQIEPIAVPDHINTVVIWEDTLADYYKNHSRPLKKIKSDLNDTSIYFFNLQPGDKLIYDYHYLTVSQGFTGYVKEGRLQ